MNKFEKLMLASAIFVTSELVAMEEYIPNTILEDTTLKVSGKVTANTAVTINGTLKVDDGEVTNNAIMTYGESGSLVINNTTKDDTFEQFKQSSLENENNDPSMYDTCFPTKGVLDVSAITKDSTNATFSGGKIVGGTIKLKHGTNKFKSLSVGADSDLPIVGVYQYDASMANRFGTRINNKYIKAENVTSETKSPEEQFRSEFKDSDQISFNQDFEGQTDVAGGTTIKGLYLFADPETKASDGRKDFPGLLTDAELNTGENKLKTDDIIYERDSADENYGKSAIIGLKDTSTLAVSTTINSEPIIRIGFEGNRDLSFAGFETKTESETTTIDYDRELDITSLTFSGDNSGYTGTASFGEKIAKVVADGNNTLPKKLGESIKGNLENKSGTNTIDNAGTTTIGSLTLSGGELTISKDTTIIIGE